MYFEMDCPCKGKNLDKMLQRGILMSLYRQDKYGWLIIRDLGKNPMFGGIGISDFQAGKRAGQGCFQESVFHHGKGKSLSGKLAGDAAQLCRVYCGSGQQYGRDSGSY